MNIRKTLNRTITHFFLLVFALSIPFWILGAVMPDMTKILPIKLPISALMTFCPLIAAVIMVSSTKQYKGVQLLLQQCYDFKKINNKKWLIPVILFMPVIAFLSYLFLQWNGKSQDTEQNNLFSIILFFLIYFIGAIGEEIGWNGYLTNPLQKRLGALKAGLLAGSIWAVWHIIPWSQAHQNAVWIFWQSIATVFLRVIMVWLFNNSGKSVFAMILFHTMINISPYLVPGNGSHYDPQIFAILLLFCTSIIICFWDIKTFTIPKILIK